MKNEVRKGFLMRRRRLVHNSGIPRASRKAMSTLIVLLGLLFTHVLSFNQFSNSGILRNTQHASRKDGNLHMVFDFLRKRSEEGIAQLQNIASKTLQGNLKEALSESAEYIKTRRQIDAENMKRLTEGYKSLPFFE